MKRKGTLHLCVSRHVPGQLVKAFFTIISLFVYSLTFGQSNYHVLAKIDDIVQETDKIADKSQRTFYLNKINKQFDGIKETWNYTMHDGKIAVFQVRYVTDSIEFTEIYYVNKGQLIYSEEYETVYITSSSDDEIRWGGIYYFVSNNLKQRVTLGSKNGRFLHWNVEAETLARFQRRFSELRENIPLTAKN